MATGRSVGSSDRSTATWRPAIRGSVAVCLDTGSVETERSRFEQPHGWVGSCAWPSGCLWDDPQAGVCRALFADDTDYPGHTSRWGGTLSRPRWRRQPCCVGCPRRTPSSSGSGRFCQDVVAAGALPDPVTVTDSPGGRELHLVGLNLSLAWCLATLADELPGRPYTPTPGV